jgi:hypothetical protein
VTAVLVLSGTVTAETPSMYSYVWMCAPIHAANACDSQISA